MSRRMGRKTKPEREPLPKEGGSYTFNPNTGKWLPTGTVVDPAGELDNRTDDSNDGTDS